MEHDRVSQNPEELFKSLRLPICEQFGCALIWRSSSLQHIGRQCPGRSGKSYERFPHSKPAPRAAHCCVNGREFLLPDCRIGIQQILAGKITKYRSDTFFETNLLTQSMGYDQNVGKEDRG